MSDNELINLTFSAEELAAIQVITVRESIRLEKMDRAMLGSEYFFISAEKIS